MPNEGLCVYDETLTSALTEHTHKSVDNKTIEVSCNKKPFVLIWSEPKVSIDFHVNRGQKR